MGERGSDEPPDGDPSDGSTRTILLVEDDDELRETYRIWLPDERWQVEEAGTGRGALETVDASVDVLVLDRHLPDLAGPEVAARLGDTGFCGDVVVISAYEPDDHLAEADVESYVTKPIDRARFLATLRETVRTAAPEKTERTP